MKKPRKGVTWSSLHNRAEENTTHPTPSPAELDDLLLPWMLDLPLLAHLDHDALKEHHHRVGKVLCSSEQTD